jgi:alpha-glucosidase
MLEILDYWLIKGADGFRIDAINFMFETDGLPDEDYIDPEGDKTTYDNLKHTHTKDRPESYEFIYDVREMMDKFVASTEDKVTRLMMTEAYAPISEQVKWYGANETRLGAHFPFNFALITAVDDDSDAANFSNVIDSWVEKQISMDFKKSTSSNCFRCGQCQAMELPTG